MLSRLVVKYLPISTKILFKKINYYRELTKKIKNFLVNNFSGTLMRLKFNRT